MADFDLSVVPKDVFTVCNKLRDAQKRAWIVGGCVRDSLLGKQVADWDVCTDARPNELMKIFPRAVPTGLQHGTVTVVVKGKPFEVTTLRRDVSTDGRRATVAFTESWEEDAQRRDFRINALYADASGAIHDPTGGGLDDARAGRRLHTAHVADTQNEVHVFPDPSFRGRRRKLEPARQREARAVEPDGVDAALALLHRRARLHLELGRQTGAKRLGGKHQVVRMVALPWLRNNWPQNEFMIGAIQDEH